MAVVNFKNMDDDMCLNYVIIGSRYYTKMNKKNTVQTYKKFMRELKIPENQTYPIDVMTDIPLYEQLNKIKINVWELVDENIMELYIDKFERALEVINILLIHDENKSHFVWIKDISRLFASKTTGHKKYMCEQCIDFKTEAPEALSEHLKRCMKRECCSVSLPSVEQQYTYKCSRCASSNYQSIGALEEHLKLCTKKDACMVKLPKPSKNITKFKNFSREFKHPFHVFADFESTLQRVNDLNDVNQDTKKYQKHIQNSFGLKYNCIHPKHDEEVKICNDKNPLEVNKQFIEELEKLALKSYNLTQIYRNKILYKPSEKEIHIQTKNCKNCNNTFSKENKKVAHHDHITGEFIST